MRFESIKELTEWEETMDIIDYEVMGKSTLFKGYNWIVYYTRDGEFNHMVKAK